jgi:four helix bundle protein
MVEVGVPDVRSYRDLDVWILAMSLAEDCYRVTKKFPKDEMYGMTSQIRRSAASIPANIAEGYGRETTGLFIQFLRIAQGSLKELETHAMLSERVAILNAEDASGVLARCESVSKMLRNLIRALQAKGSETG